MQPRPREREDCYINPLLQRDRLDWRYSQYIEPVVRGSGSRGFVNLSGTTLKYENASLPAVSEARFSLVLCGRTPRPPLCIRGTGDGGRVTVKDVLDGVADGFKGVIGDWPEDVEGRRWTGIGIAFIFRGVLLLFAKAD